MFLLAKQLFIQAEQLSFARKRNTFSLICSQPLNVFVKGMHSKCPVTAPHGRRG